MAPSAAWIAFLAGLGKYASQNDVHPGVNTGLWVVNSLAWYLYPEKQSSIYGMAKLSKKATALQTVQGQAMLSTAAYLGALQLGRTRAEAFAVSWAVQSATALRFALTKADDVDCSRSGVYIWAALSAGIAALALA